MMKRLRSQSGVTLLELVLCIAMLGILGYVASPILGSSTSALSLDAAAKQVEADLRYAQNMATTTDNDYRWETKTSGDSPSYSSYRVYDVTNSATATSPYNHQAMNLDLSTSYPNTTFSANNYTVNFARATGVPSGDLSITITNSGTDPAKTKTITITSAGKINVD